MNFDYLKDLVSLNPIKTTYVSNNLKNSFIFIVEDHVKEKSLCKNSVTLLEKLNKIFKMFLNDELDQSMMYQLFGDKLKLNHSQFDYLYQRTKNDAQINNIITQIITVIDCYIDNVDEIKSKLLITIDELDGFANVSSFLIRECNCAATANANNK
ncbi:ORF_93 [Adoxophyes orana granulovirus]|uniref:ADOR93 n=1 Tax=Adoxophyes orana granulovirus TaxID=170617 RepID=Q7T9S2_GVAO|nr:ORF_93 [Adoxophyes orana granulovirus]AAP85730.1 ORF_93 [Adoxophyes orana granulovirus]AJA91733.1 ADOR93 [Adoxophyes orana granulovirus]